MNPKYPNLELLEHIFKEYLQRDNEWKTKWDAIKSVRKVLEIDVEVFPQVWGSTCTAFDILPDGSAAIGGCAMTKAYTVVFVEHLTETYGVFVDGKPCYMVKDANEAFYNDLASRNIASLKMAKERY